MLDSAAAHPQGRRQRAGRRAGQARREPADPGRPLHRRRPANAAAAASSTDEQIADLVAWVKIGVPGAADRRRPTRPSRAPAASSTWPSGGKHWAYQPVPPAPPPAVKDARWCRVADRRASSSPELEAAGLVARPAGRPPHAHPPRHLRPDRPAADARGGRRVPGRRVARRLRAAGRSAARLARTTASAGAGTGSTWSATPRRSATSSTTTCPTPGAYRDYVIRAFNADVPYDQFVIEQLAGDLLPQPRRHPADGCNESILATGFFWLGEGKQTPVDIRQEQADRIDNQIDVLGKAFLGLTVACARCHDHKFDAISHARLLRPGRLSAAARATSRRSSTRPARIAGPAPASWPQLKATIRDLASAELAAPWLGQASGRAATCWPPGGEVLRVSKAKADAGRICAGCREFGLDRSRLDRWVRPSRRRTSAIDHPLHAWSQAGGPGRSDGRSIPAAPPGLDDARASRRTGPLGPSGPERRLEVPPIDSRGLVSSRGALLAGPARPAKSSSVTPGAAGRPSSRAGPTAVLSEAPAGRIASPTFTIDKRYVHLRLAGRTRRVNLVIDGNTLIMNPMYGKLTAAPEGGRPGGRCPSIAGSATGPTWR